MLSALNGFRGRRPFQGRGRWENDRELLERVLAFTHCRCGRCSSPVRLLVPAELWLMVGPWGQA